MEELLTFAAREVARTLAGAGKATLTALRNQVMKRAWLALLVDWAMERVTGRDITGWLEKGLDSLTEALGGKDPNSLVSAILHSPQVKVIIQTFRDEIVAAYRTSDGSAVYEWEVHNAPIPAELSLFRWAEGVGARFGVPALEVLKQRLA